MDDALAWGQASALLLPRCGGHPNPLRLCRQRARCAHSGVALHATTRARRGVIVSEGARVIGRTVRVQTAVRSTLSGVGTDDHGYACVW